MPPSDEVRTLEVGSCLDVSVLKPEVAFGLLLDTARFFEEEFPEVLEGKGVVEEGASAPELRVGLAVLPCSVEDCGASVLEPEGGVVDPGL